MLGDRGEALLDQCSWRKSALSCLQSYCRLGSTAGVRRRTMRENAFMADFDVDVAADGRWVVSTRVGRTRDCVRGPLFHATDGRTNHVRVRTEAAVWIRCRRATCVSTTWTARSTWCSRATRYSPGSHRDDRREDPASARHVGVARHDRHWREHQPDREEIGRRRDRDACRVPALGHSRHPVRGRPDRLRVERRRETPGVRGTKVNGGRVSNSFRREDAERFVEAVKARMDGRHRQSREARFLRPSELHSRLAARSARLITRRL